MSIDTTVTHNAGESLAVLERVIVAPSVGVFQPLAPEAETPEGEMVSEGQAVGTLVISGKSTPVRSPFTGFLMGMLARPGERVRAGQPVAWLRAVGA
jgi:biotin carboxyl carrier protein